MSRVDKNSIQSYIRSKLSKDNYLSVKKISKRLLGFIHSDNLNKLATINGTDKWNDHWYTQHYQRHFTPFKHKRVKILEIGIGGYDDPYKGGDSLRMWKSYFSSAEIHGIDVVDKSPHKEKRIHIHQGSQVDIDFLNQVISKHGPFDIIIDDGSHINEHVIFSFENLFLQGLTEKGIYVIEDTQTSYWSNYGGIPDKLDNATTMMNYFRKLVDVVNCQDYLWEKQLSSKFDHYITGMHFYHNLIFIYKGSNRNEDERHISKMYK